MAWWDPRDWDWDWLVDGAKAVGSALSSALEKVGEEVIDIAKIPLEHVGEVIEDSLDKIGDIMNTGFSTLGLDEIGKVFNFYLDRIGERIHWQIEWVNSYPEKLARLTKSFLSTELFTDPQGWIEKVASAYLDASGLPHILETIADILKFNTRGMTKREVEIARSVFGDSIDYDNVRIDEASFFAWQKDKAWVAFHTVHFERKIDISDVGDAAWLIHELTHVWQYETMGPRNIVEAIALERIPVEDRYDYGEYAGLQDAWNNGKKFTDFNIEQQGEILEAYFEKRENRNAADDYQLPLYAEFVSTASTLSAQQLASHLSVLSKPLHGGRGADTLVGDGGRNSLDGGNGDDTLSGLGGADVLQGGKGHDTADYSASAVGIFVSLRTGRGSGGDAEGDELRGIENLVGSAFADTLVGYVTSTLNGGAGDDMIIGAGETLVGGEGTDTASYADSAHVDANLETGNASATYVYRVEDRWEGEFGWIPGSETFSTYNGALASIENLIGSAYDDRLVGDQWNNRLDGGAGNDQLLGQGGSDELFGGQGVDTLDGGDHNDFLYGGEGDDSIFGGEGADWLHGEAGDDYVDGQEGDDVVGYEWAPDAVTMSLELVGAQYVGTGMGHDTLLNIEHLVGSYVGGDWLTGHSGNNWLAGYGGNDTLAGRAGDDGLEGHEGDDVLYGETGNDHLVGGQGRDTFVFAVGSGEDWIGLSGAPDFVRGEDIIDLQGFLNIDDLDHLLGNAVFTSDGMQIDLGAANGDLTGLDLLTIVGLTDRNHPVSAAGSAVHAAARA